MLYLFRSHASPISFSVAYVYELLSYTFHIHLLYVVLNILDRNKNHVHTPVATGRPGRDVGPPDRHTYPTDHVHAQRKRGRHGRGG